MAEVNNIVSQKAILTIAFYYLCAFIIPGVHGFDGGDAAALVIGLLVAILGFFACLGYYARKKGGV